MLFANRYDVTVSGITFALGSMATTHFLLPLGSIKYVVDTIILCSGYMWGKKSELGTE